MFLKSQFKRKMMYREYTLTNTFNSEFDYCKKEGVIFEKFVKISSKEWYLTICTNPNKYFFFAICWKSKNYYLLVIYRKKMLKLLNKYDNSLSKVSRLLRIKNGNLYLKNMDFILKDKLNISNCLPLSYRLHRSRSRSNHDKSNLSDSYERVNEKKRLESSMTEKGKQNETQMISDKYSLPKVC